MIDFFLHLEQLLPVLLAEYGLWIFAILFLIIFAETGFVFMFFLPGDSLLIAIGALCKLGFNPYPYHGYFDDDCCRIGLYRQLLYRSEVGL